jgi:uncharacterized SAM-binding protein YcdF (DUF218 family)
MTSVWTSTWALRNILAQLLMPPSCWIVLALLVLIVLRRQKKLQMTLLVLLFALMWVTSTSIFSQSFYQWSASWMHWPNPLDMVAMPRENIERPTRAIIVLGGGVRMGAIDVPQYLNQDISKEQMERLRMGARLAKITQAPILVSGGRPDQTSTTDRPEGEIMAQVLREEFGVNNIWIEAQSNTTQENAHLSAKILREHQIKTIYLVSHDWHIPRAKYIFEKEGFTIIPAPVGFQHNNYFTPLDYFPSNDGFAQTRHIWHELIGQVWYRWRF